MPLLAVLIPMATGERRLTFWEVSVVDFNEDSMSIPPRGWLRLNVHMTDRGKYHTGAFMSRDGFVEVYRQDPDPAFKKGYTRLDAVIDGRLVYRTWEKRLGERTIYREARAMLEAA
jgi:hypothetical protein